MKQLNPGRTLRRVLVLHKDSTYQTQALEKKDPRFLKLLAEGSEVVKTVSKAHEQHLQSLDQVVAAPLLASGASVEIPPMQGQQFAAQAADGTVAVVGNAGREGWRSVYSSRVPLPATYLREIASAAGVHLYSDNPKDQVTLGARIHF